jgi:hypothetical protein
VGVEVTIRLARQSTAFDEQVPAPQQRALPVADHELIQGDRSQVTGADAGPQPLRGQPGNGASRTPKRVTYPAHDGLAILHRLSAIYYAEQGHH